MTAPATQPFRHGLSPVTVLSMTEASEPLPDQAVVFQNGRILAVGPAASVDIPAEAELIDGTGKYIMPGLIDAHVHFFAESIPELPYSRIDSLLPYFAHGVTHILDMASSEHTAALAREIDAGGYAAPQISTAVMVDGEPPIRPDAAIAIGNASEVEQVVSSIGDDYDFIKIYSNLDRHSFEMLIELAGRRGVRVVGHIPGRDLPVDEFIVPGFSMISHAEEFAFRSLDMSDEDIARFVDLMRNHGVALTSTLVLDQLILAQMRDPSILLNVEGVDYVDPITLDFWFENNRYTSLAFAGEEARQAAIVGFNDRLVKAMVDAGVPVLAGTDTFIPGTVPGLALHQELSALVEAGLTPQQALEAATRVPAGFLGLQADIGTIERDKEATMLLLSESPLDSIDNIRAIDAVIARGTVFERAELDARLERLAASYREVRPYVAPVALSVLQEASLEVTAPTNDAANACDAGQYQAMVGEHLNSVDIRLSGARSRALCSSCAADSDLDLRRITIRYDDSTGTVITVSCG